MWYNKTHGVVKISILIIISCAWVSIIILYNLIETLPGLGSMRYIDEISGFTIKPKGCSIPELKPFNDEIKQFILPPPVDVACPNANYTLLNHNKTHIWLEKDKNVLEFYNIKNRSQVVCIYTSFHQPDDIIKDHTVSSVNYDYKVKYDKRRIFTDSIAVQGEFIKVVCNNKKKIIAHQYFLFAIKKEISQVNKDKNTNDKQAFNVLIVGLDGISRMNFYRTMPRTLKYFNENGAIELLGFNKVGENSFPNLIPLLTGLSPTTELMAACHSDNQTTFDDCPFIWKKYEEAGYFTAFGEDSARFGLLTNPAGKQHGFHKSPTTYYLPPFFIEAERTASASFHGNFYVCLNQTFMNKMCLEYIENLTDILKSSKLFGFFWESSISHDYLHYPALMDEDYENFFMKLSSSGYLDKTIVFLMSDHGLRWGGIRLTKQGRVEAMLPFVYILVPPSFREGYTEAYNNLKSNTRKLTTTFDLHETLNDLTDLDKLSNYNIAIKKKNSYANNRGISLFLPIPSNRTCESVEIADHFCACHQSKEISVQSEEAISASKNLLMHINQIVSGNKKCKHLELHTVRKVEKLEYKSSRDGNVTAYVVALVANPGHGLFEGTIRRGSNDNWTVAGTISRLNNYDSQSHCEYNLLHKPYCLCK